MPSLRHCSVGRREGPSMAQRGYPGIHAGMPTPQYLRSAIVVNGAPQIKIKVQSEAALKPACFEASTVGVHSLCTRHKNLWICGCSPYLGTTQKPVGAGLLAKAVVQLALMLAVPTSSRASSLPQVFVSCAEAVNTHSARFKTGRLSGRLAGGPRSNVRAEP